jgi:magnesium transporter
MPYVSQLIGKPVTDVNGVRAGRLRDIIARPPKGSSHPEVVGILVSTRAGAVAIAFTEVAVLVAPAIPLAHDLAAARRLAPAESDILLMRDIMDQQIIDVNDVRVVRVNDVELARVNGSFYVANVDTGSTGLLRRLGLLWMRPAGRRGAADEARGVIPWDAVEPVGNNRKLRLKVSGERIAELHPADLAGLLGDLNRTDGSSLLESLDPKTAAEALEEAEPDLQASLVEDMTDRRAANLLEEMAPDEAADLLAELPEERSKSILGMMEKEEAADVRKLLTYPEDSAGGIMTTEYITVSAGKSAAAAMKTIRQAAREAETIYYVYVTDRKNRLEGVFSLKELVRAEPRTTVAQLMHTRVVSVRPLESQETVAQLVSRYNLLAVPVVDDENRIQGIVTADDALDKIIPTAWKKRLPRLYH